MQAAGLKNGLLITADPYSKIVDPEDRNTTMLFGDAATATWMGENAVWQLGEARFGTDGSGAEHLKVSDGTFFMNGRQVFNFALVKVPAHLHELLAASGLQSSDIDAFCIHQGSAAIVDAVARRFEEQHPEKFVKDMLETGNTVSSSVPLLLQSTCSIAAGGVWPSVVSVWGCPGVRQLSIATDSRRSRKTPGVFRQAFFYAQKGWSGPYGRGGFAPRWPVQQAPIVRRRIDKPLILWGGWVMAFFRKCPQATHADDDKHYEGSLGHTRRMPGPEAAVPIQRGFRHGFNCKHQHCFGYYSG